MLIASKHCGVYPSNDQVDFQTRLSKVYPAQADDVALATDIEEPADAAFIADARTALPVALAALKAVLELANNPYPDVRNISGWEIVRTVGAALRSES